MANPGADYGVVELQSKMVANTTKERGDTDDGTLPPFSLAPSMEPEKHYYGVRVVNGRMKAAGTTGGVDTYITLIGTDGSTGKVSLLGILGFLFKGMRAGTYEDLVIKTEKSLGEVQVVILGIDGAHLALDSEWFIEFTEVQDLTKQSNSIRFPCYHWVKANEHVSSTSQTTTLNTLANNPILKHERASQLETRKQLYQWQLFPEGVPSGIDDKASELPLDEEFDRVKNIDFTKDGLKSVIAANLAGKMITVDTLRDYADLAKFIDDGVLPLEQAGRWASDVEFGRQMLNGVNPVIIKKCASLPPNFPVTNEMVQPLLTRGMTLQQELEAGHVYICDMRIIDGLPTKADHYAPAPLCLLYVNSSKQLVPIAIQIKQGLREEEKNQPNPIFLPTDNYFDWLLAKIYYQSVHAQLHQLSTHYQSCHAAMEAYGVATARNLPDAHPINKLLCPHYRFTMAINSRARATLINDGGIIDQTFGIGTQGRIEAFKRAYTAYSVDSTNIKKSVQSRGVDDPEQLPGYHYRDDGLKLFEAIEGFVTDIIDAFYPSDQDVASDAELQNWSHDIFHNGFPSFFGEPQGHGFPEAIATKSQLIERCTVIIFTGSAQHASINFGQYVLYGYTPNAPFALRNPPPTEKGVVDHQLLVETLPDEASAIGILATTYILSQYSSGEIFLGSYPYQRFTDPKVLSYIEKFQKKLVGISEEIQTRNKSLDVPYIYMLPANVPNSITI